MKTKKLFVFLVFIFLFFISTNFINKSYAYYYSSVEKNYIYIHEPMIVNGTGEYVYTHKGKSEYCFMEEQILYQNVNKYIEIVNFNESNKEINFNHNVLHLYSKNNFNSMDILVGDIYSVVEYSLLFKINFTDSGNLYLKYHIAILKNYFFLSFDYYDNLIRITILENNNNNVTLGTYPIYILQSRLFLYFKHEYNTTDEREHYYLNIKTIDNTYINVNRSGIMCMYSFPFYSPECFSIIVFDGHYYLLGYDYNIDNLDETYYTEKVLETEYRQKIYNYYKRQIIRDKFNLPSYNNYEIKDKSIYSIKFCILNLPSYGIINFTFKGKNNQTEFVNPERGNYTLNPNNFNNNDMYLIIYSSSSNMIKFSINFKIIVQYQFNLQPTPFYITMMNKLLNIVEPFLLLFILPIVLAMFFKSNGFIIGLILSIILNLAMNNINWPTAIILFFASALLLMKKLKESELIFKKEEEG